MVSKKRAEIDWAQAVANALVTLVIVTVFGTIMIKYLGTPEPILYMNPPDYPWAVCHLNGFDIGQDYGYQLYLSNKGETPAFSQLCFYADNITFKVEGNTYKNQVVCYPERRLSPKSSDLVQGYKPIIFINATEAPKNLTIRTTASCSYKILSLINKQCEVLTNDCKYEKVGDRYRYIK